MDYETPQFYRVMQYAARADRDVVDMVSGSPDWDPPEGIRDGLYSYADADAAQFQYAPSRGVRELRCGVAARHGVGEGRIVVTNGTGEANHLAMVGGLERFPGDEILLVDPVYPYYAGRANFLDADLNFVAAGDDGQPDPSAVRDAASQETAVIVVNSPNNPTGAVYDADTVAALVDVAAANDALLVSDEVYERFDYSGRFSSALAADSSNVVVTNGFSKSMAITGFRVGYAVFPPTDGPTGDLVAGATTRHMLTNVSGSRPAQHAVVRALESTPPSYYEDARTRVQKRLKAFCDALDAVAAEYTRPDGGFYVLARFADYPGSFESVYELIDGAGVAGMPGEAFGGAGPDWIRFSLTTPRVDEAAARLVDFLD